MHEGDHVEAERLAIEVGVIAGNDLLVLQPHPPPRALRGGQSDSVGELLVGQPAIILQGGENLEVEAVDYNHALNWSVLHEVCTYGVIVARSA